jgi:hypothetical protein
MDNVETPEKCEAVRDRACDVAFMRHVGAHKLGASPLCGYTGDDRASTILIASDRNNRSALASHSLKDS